MKTILIVDDEEKIAEIFIRIFVEEGFLVRHAYDARRAFNIIVREKIDLVLLDIKMPEIDGKYLFDVIKEYDPNLKVIMSSVFPVEKQRQLVPTAIDYFDKSQGWSQLLRKVEEVLAA